MLTTLLQRFQRFKQSLDTPFTISHYKQHPELNGKYSNRRIHDILQHVASDFVPLACLMHNFASKEWDDTSRRRFSAQDFLNNPDDPKFQTHKRRYEHADVVYPLEIWLDGDTNQYVILDGVHRLCKLFVNLQPHELVEVKILTDDHLRQIQLGM
jgi:hypothetical protein